VGTIDPSKAQSPLVLALDVGTSSCRASVYDAGGRAIAALGSQRSYAPVTTADGRAELTADELLEHVADAIDGVAREAPAVLGRVVAVATCTFWHSLLGLDQAGRPATPLYLWMDARARGAMEPLKRRLDERAAHARTGCVFHWSYWPARLLWLSQAEPDVFREVRRWVSFGEYLIERLTGEAGVSVSMASGTGLLNQHTCLWDEELLGALPIQPHQLSPLGGPRPEVHVLRPPFADRWPQLRKAGWLRPVGDGACSNLGAGCATRERLALMVGTSGAMRALSRTDEASAHDIVSFAIPWGSWCYRADSKRVVLGGALNDGGSLLAWLRTTLQLPASPDADQELAALGPDEHGLTLLPLWAGERSPRWAVDASGAIVGLRLHTRPIDILRAAIEAVAVSFARIEAVLRPAVPEAREIVATGAALLRSPAWLQIMADVLGRPVLASAEPEASSRGAALLALEALEAFSPGWIESQTPSIERVYEPVAARTERYQAAAERQARLYEALVASGRGGETAKRGGTGR
jgi:gluconokinase